MKITRRNRLDAGGRSQSPIRRRAAWVLVPLAVFGAVGAVVYYQTTSADSTSDMVYGTPSAPRLTAGPSEQLFRIDPTRSSVTYDVAEQLVGFDASHAKGSTSGVAGDIALNSASPPASRLGTIVVNVEQLHSDNRLRDARIRDDFLESHKYPLVTLSNASISGLPAKIENDTPYKFRIKGTLKVKGAEAPVEWAATARSTDGEIHIAASTTLKMSSFDVGPIRLLGLVSTSDDVKLSMDLVATDAAKLTVPATLPAPTGPKESVTQVSFRRDVQPVLQSSCASCHAKGESGAEHWQLDTAADASQIAEGIGTVVKSGYMPPWPASEVGVPLAHSKRLDNSSIAQLVDWAAAGGKLDVPAETPIIPTPSRASKTATPREDLTLRMPEAYAGSADVRDDYRCFILDPKFTSATFMTGYSVTPTERSVVHHSQIFHITADQVDSIQMRSGSDGKPGWSCLAGPTLPSGPRPQGSGTGQAPGQGAPGGMPTGGPPAGAGGAPNAGVIAGWAPGQDPVRFPLRSGILMQPGDVLVLQMHYHYESKPVADRTTVKIEVEPGTADLKALTIVNPLGPVEIPCDAGATEPLCDREASLAEAGRLYGRPGSAIEPALLGLCGRTASELAATYNDGTASSSCDYKVPVDGQIVSTMGHMHTLGSTFRLTLEPDGPSPTVLLDIPQWDFDWQMNYDLQTPVHVTAGQTIRMDCSWDRKNEPRRPQKYVIFAEGTEDEMCFSTYAIVPDK